MITAPPKKEYPLLPPGSYTLKVSVIKDKPQAPTKFGPRDKIAFGFDALGTADDDGKPLRVWADFYKSFGIPPKTSRLCVFVERILGRKLSEADRAGFDEQQLMNLTIEADVVHNTYNGKTYANIDEFYKNRRVAAATEPDEEPVPF